MRTLLFTIVCLLGAAFFADLSGGAPRKAAAQDEPDAFRVIIHPGNPVSHVRKDFLRDAFLKRVTDWPNGQHILPVDQSARSKVRELFARDVMQRPLAALRMHWQQQVFSGRGLPPPELESDAAVIRYVTQHGGAVGYVSVQADLEAVRTVRWQ